MTRRFNYLSIKIIFSEDIEKTKKEMKKSKEDSEAKIKSINEKINTLQTSVENTKTDLAFIHKSKKHLTTEKEGMEKELAAI